MVRIIVGALLAAAVFQATDYLLNAYRKERVCKNYAEVVPGVLHRSGQMRPEHFRAVLARAGIRTVVCLNPGEQDYEENIARELGVRYVTFPMPGSGQGEARYFHDYLKILGEPENRPLLVHCNAGAYRTGAAVALYRVVYQGWTLKDAAREMKYHGFAGQQDLLDHITNVLATVPAALRAKVGDHWEVAHAK